MIGEKRVLDVGIEVMGHTAIDLFFFLPLFDYRICMCSILREGEKMKEPGGEPEPLRRRQWNGSLI